MATLGAYNQVFYANQALIYLRNVLGMASRVYLGYDAERRSAAVGDTITIKRPSTFSAVAAPGSASTLVAGSVSITLDQWYEVKFALTDKELAYTGEQIMRDHIGPASYALARQIDSTLAGLYKDVPWLYDYGATTDATIITGTKNVLFGVGVPMDDNQLHMMVDGTVNTYFQNSTIFHSASVAGPAAQDTLLRGSLGTRFGVEVFAAQGAPTHTPGSIASTGDAAGAVNNGAGYAVGATSMAVDAFTAAETLKAGDTFVITGNSQRYAITADTAMTSGAGTISFTPGLAVTTADNAVITFTQQTASAHTQQLMFHTNAFALAFAPLPTDLPGIEVFTAVDPASGLALRARRWADGANSQVFQSIDALWGVKTLDPNLAARAWT